eukprot:COSAG02_NODE_160_length_32694_cov_18.496947_9_plen_1666_part_00
MRLSSDVVRAAPPRQAQGAAAAAAGGAAEAEAAGGGRWTRRYVNTERHSRDQRLDVCLCLSLSLVRALSVRACVSESLCLSVCLCVSVCVSAGLWVSLAMLTGTARAAEAGGAAAVATLQSPAPVWAPGVEAHAAAGGLRLRAPVAGSPAPPQAAPAAVPGVWRMYVDDEGDPYYYNATTEETTWERPSDFVDVPDQGVVPTANDTLVREGADPSEGAMTTGNRRVLVVSSAVVKLQSQFILGAAREDVAVILFDDSTTSPSALVAMIKAAVPRAGRLAMLGFMTQPYADTCVSSDGTAVVELVRGQSEQTSRRSLRSDRTLNQFWQDVGALVQDGGCIDLLKSNIGRAHDCAWLLADLERLTNCAVTAEESLVESSGEKYFDMANLSLLIRGSTDPLRSGVAGPPFTTPSRGSGYPTAQREPPSNLLHRDRVLPGSGERALPLSVPQADEASPVRSAWRRYFDEDGDAYFANAETGETTWDAPAQFVDQPNERVAEHSAQDSISQQHTQKDEQQWIVRKEMSDQVAAGREEVAQALSQVQQLLAQAKAEEAAGVRLAQEQREAKEQERKLQQEEAAAAAAAVLAEQGNVLDSGVLSPSILAARAAGLLSKEREQRAEDLEREKTERSVLALQASQALAQEKMEKAAAELRASEEAQAKVEALAELANMRQQKEDLERHIAGEAMAKSAAEALAATAKKEAADREAQAAAREVEAEEAREEAAALAARISGLVEESIRPRLSLPSSGLTVLEDQSYLQLTGKGLAMDDSALVAASDDQSFKDSQWSAIVGRAEHWQGIVASAEEQALRHANQSIAEQMLETEREKLHAIEEAERKKEALQVQLDTASKEEQQRRLAAEALAQEWRLKAEEADRALEAAAEAEAAANAELQRQREKPDDHLTTTAAVKEAIDRAHKAESAEKRAKEDACTAQAKFVEHLKESAPTTAAAVQAAVDRSLKAESAEQLAKKDARAAQAKFDEHQHSLAKEQRARENLEERVKFEVEASQAAEAARTATQQQLSEAREMLHKQQSSASEQQQAAAAAEAKLEEEMQRAESIEAQRADMDVERKRLAEMAHVATREAAELDRSRALDHEARVIAEEGLVEEQKKRKEAEARAMETELALAKAEQLLRAHEETADFYMAKAQEEAAKDQMQSLSPTAMFSAEELQHAAEQAARKVAAAAVPSMDTHNYPERSGERDSSVLTSPVDDVMHELGKYQNALAESDVKIAAALTARESAESTAKSATDQALSQAQKATQQVDALADELAKARAEQERHHNEAAELASERAHAEEQNTRMLAELADAQRQLAEAMGVTTGSRSASAKTAAVEGWAEAAGTAEPTASAAAAAVGGGTAASGLTEENELLAELFRSDPEVLERQLKQKKNEQKALRQKVVEDFYKKQQWYKDEEQNPNSPWPPFDGPKLLDRYKQELRELQAAAAPTPGAGTNQLSGGVVGAGSGAAGALRSSFRTGLASLNGVTGGGWQQQQQQQQPPLPLPPPRPPLAGGSSDDELPPPPPPPPLDGSHEDGIPPPPPPADDEAPPPPAYLYERQQQQQQQQQQQLGLPPAQMGTAPGGAVDPNSKAGLLNWVDNYCSARPGASSCRTFGTSFNDGIAFCAVLSGAGLLEWSEVITPAQNNSARAQVRKEWSNAVALADTCLALIP